MQRNFNNGSKTHGFACRISSFHMYSLRKSGTCCKAVDVSISSKFGCKNYISAAYFWWFPNIISYIERLRQIFRKDCGRKVRKDIFYIKSRQPSEQKFKMCIKCPNRTLSWVLGDMKSKSGFIIFFPSVTVHYAMVTNDTLFGNTP